MVEAANCDTGVSDLARSGVAAASWGRLKESIGTARGGTSFREETTPPEGGGTALWGEMSAPAKGGGTSADGPSGVGTGLAALEGWGVGPRDGTGHEPASTGATAPTLSVAEVPWVTLG